MKIKRYMSLSDEKKETGLFILCWLTYFCVYAGRLNYPAAMVQMVSDGFISKAEGGLVATFFFAAYGCGQLVMGFVSDRVSPFKMILSGMAFSALCNFFMAAFPGNNIAALGAIWGSNGVAQSVIWSPIVKIFAQILSPKRRIKASVNILTVSPAGALFTYVLSTVLLKYFNWKSVFYSGGIIIAAAWAILLVYFISNKKLFITEEIEIAQKTKTEKTHRPAAGASNIKAICVIMAIFFLPAMIHGMLKESITAWFPVYLAEYHDVVPYLAVLLTTLLPVFNLVGLYAAKRIYDKTGSSEFITCAIMFAACGCGLGLMFLAGRYNLYLAALLAAVATASMLGVNCIVVSVLPMHFGARGLASTITGALDAVIYFGCSISMAVFGAIVETCGWAATVSVWFALAASGVLLCAALKNIWAKTKEMM
jgi:OPA family glycerol-3-phosphate transporter-like MFS transporter